MARSEQPKSDSEKVVIQHISFEHIEEDVEPPPPHFTSKFKTLQDWLFNICENDKPKKSIAEFRVNFFESSGEYTLFLIGVNTYKEGKNRSITRIEFEPSNMYFNLPKSDYKNLNRQQLQDKVTFQLKDFTETETFKTSFLTKANVITIGFSGERVWSK